MNKIIPIVILTLLACSCIGKHNSDAQTAIVLEKTKELVHQIGDTIYIDFTRSNISWKATKMRGAGKHEGEIELKNGYFIKENGQIVDGSFMVDMATISVTDIPEHEPIPRKNLTNHLKSDDFFGVEKFPTSKFDIISIDTLDSDSLKVSGNLTLKNVTKNIEFNAKYQNDIFSTKFKFDRFLWKVNYEGNLVEKNLVDKDIELTIRIVQK